MEVKRLAIVPVDSSAARIPLPGATIASAILAKLVRSSVGDINYRAQSIILPFMLYFAYWLKSRTERRNDKKGINFHFYNF